MWNAKNQYHNQLWISFETQNNNIALMQNNEYEKRAHTKLDRSSHLMWSNFHDWDAINKCIIIISCSLPKWTFSFSFWTNLRILIRNFQERKLLLQKLTTSSLQLHRIFGSIITCSQFNYGDYHVFNFVCELNFCCCKIEVDAWAIEIIMFIISFWSPKWGSLRSFSNDIHIFNIQICMGIV